MFKKQPPAISIGSSLGATSNSITPAFAYIAANTSVQPSAIERVGDALGNLIWKSVPVVKAVALGTFAMAVAPSNADEEPDEGAPWLYTEHYDDLQWRWHREND